MNKWVTSPILDSESAKQYPVGILPPSIPYLLERIPAGDLRKAAKIVVEREYFMNPVFQGKGDKMRVVHQISRNTARGKNILQNCLVGFCLG